MDAQTMPELNQSPNADTVITPMADMVVCGSENEQLSREPQVSHSSLQQTSKSALPFSYRDE